MLQGLQNLGNTCSVNTLIQCIGHTMSLRAWLIDNYDSKGQVVNDHSKLLLSRELSRLTHEMWVENKSLAPFLFMRAFYDCLRGLPRGEQHDMMELWMLLVDKMNTEIGTPQATPGIKSGNNDSGSDIEGFAKAWECHNGKCMSPWLKRVQGWTVTNINCKACGGVGKMYEPFCCLELAMSYGDASGDVAEMFRTMFQTEEIEERTCDFCNARAPASKATCICMYPEVLVCCFKRFEVTPNGHTQKRGDPIDIPMYIKPAHIDHRYQLCSIGNHVGSLHGGHYYATAKNPDGSWNSYDDISISHVSNIHEVIQNNREAYMLFYERAD